MSGGLGTVVIGGGTGFIGSALVEAFQNIGSKVWVVSRMPGPGQFSWHDLNKEGLPEDTKIVINLAGQNILDPFKGWSSGFKQNVYSSRINTTSAMAGAINRAVKKPDVFIQVSGIGYYPYSQTEVFDESSPGGDNYFSNLVRDWESAGILPTNINTRRVIIRSGVVLGHGGGMIKNIYTPFWLGLGGPIGNGSQWFPWIHLADIVRMFMFAAESDHVTGILNGTAPVETTNLQFTKALARAMWRPALIPLPEFVLNMAFGPERATMMTQGMRVRPKTALDLGYKFAFDNIDDACKELAGTLSIKDAQK